MKLKITALGIVLFFSASLLYAQHLSQIIDSEAKLPIEVFSQIIEYKGELYFSHQDKNNDFELWKYGEDKKLVQVADIDPSGSSNPRNFILVNEKLLFVASHGDYGAELWEFDGSNPPKIILDIRNGTASSGIINPTLFDDKIFFAANDGSQGSVLWMYDGVNTPAPLNQIYPGARANLPGPRIARNGFLYYFVRNLSSGKNEFWKFDGTNPPTQIPSFTGDFHSNNLAASDDQFFITGALSGLPKLWFFDENTAPQEIPGDYYSPNELTVNNGVLYFRATNSSFGTELHKFTQQSGIELLDHILPGPQSSTPLFLTLINDYIYFQAKTDISNSELFRVNSSGTIEFIADINPIGTSQPRNFIPFDNQVFFNALNENNNRILWRYDPRPCVTDVNSNEITCSELENLCVPLTFTGGQGIISMDFSFAYDPNKMTFSGAPTLGAAANSDHFDVLTFEETPGNIRGVVYLKSGAPASAQLNGPNELLCLNFDAANARNGDVLDFSYTDIEVGSLTETTEGCETDPAEITVTNTQFGGQLRYAGINNNNRKIGDLDSSPLNSITTILGIQGDCTAPTGTPINLTPDGFFTYNTDNGTSIQIIRDINNSTPVNAAINSADVLATNKIILGITSTPSISSLISADVNQDGRVTSVDASLISLRSTLSIEEYNHSKDWVFVLKEDLSNDPALLNATRHSVPVLPPCISLSALFSQGCIDPTQPSDIAGFLLGDVNLTWRNNNSASHLKTESPGTVTLHFDQIEELDQFNYSIPISFNSEMNIKSIDFDIDYNEERISISDFVSVNNANSSFWNDYNQSRFFGGLYNIDGLDENDAILSLIVKKKSGTPVPEDFTTTVAYITDQEAKIAFENQVTGMDEFETFPTPASHELHIQSNSGSIINSNIVITDLNGRSILEFPKTDLSDLSINVSSLSPGIYLLHINQSVKKIFID